MVFSLIAYKPESDDYCMGNHFDHYSSDFRLLTTENEDELFDELVFLYSREYGTGEDPYTITILINGRQISDITEDQRITFTCISRRAFVRAEKVKTDRINQRKADQLANEEKCKKEKEASDRAQYEKLKIRFG